MTIHERPGRMVPRDGHRLWHRRVLAIPLGRRDLDNPIVGATLTESADELRLETYRQMRVKYIINCKQSKR